ncbi:MAG TPA: carboxypeptidase-like regulatory domain-containing protein, partial [Bacteroidota bacterium]
MDLETPAITRHLTRWLLLLFVGMSAVAGTAFAGIYGKITGTVTDAATKEPLIGANIVLVGTNTGATTDGE